MYLADRPTTVSRPSTNKHDDNLDGSEKAGEALAKLPLVFCRQSEGGEEERLPPEEERVRRGEYLPCTRSITGGVVARSRGEIAGRVNESISSPPPILIPVRMKISSWRARAEQRLHPV